MDDDIVQAVRQQCLEFNAMTDKYEYSMDDLRWKQKWLKHIVDCEAARTLTLSAGYLGAITVPKFFAREILDHFENDIRTREAIEARQKAEAPKNKGVIVDTVENAIGRFDKIIELKKNQRLLKNWFVRGAHLQMGQGGSWVEMTDEMTQAALDHVNYKLDTMIRDTETKAADAFPNHRWIILGKSNHLGYFRTYFSNAGGWSFCRDEAKEFELLGDAIGFAANHEGHATDIVAANDITIKAVMEPSPDEFVYVIVIIDCGQRCYWTLSGDWSNEPGTAFEYETKEAAYHVLHAINFGLRDLTRSDAYVQRKLRSEDSS